MLVYRERIKASIFDGATFGENPPFFVFEAWISSKRQQTYH